MSEITVRVRRDDLIDAIGSLELRVEILRDSATAVGNAGNKLERAERYEGAANRLRAAITDQRTVRAAS